MESNRSQTESVGRGVLLVEVLAVRLVWGSEWVPPSQLWVPLPTSLTRMFEVF